MIAREHSLRKGRVKDRTGEVYGDFVVEELAGFTDTGRATWIASCHNGHRRYLTAEWFYKFRQPKCPRCNTGRGCSAYHESRVKWVEGYQR